MLFKVDFHRFPQAGVTLAVVNGPVPELTDDMWKTVGNVSASAEHKLSSGERAARASHRVLLLVPMHDSGGQVDLLPFIDKADIESPYTKAVREAYIAGSMADYPEPTRIVNEAVSVELTVTVEQPYSVKGLRSPDAIDQRIEDAVAIAKHGLLSDLPNKVKQALGQMYRLLHLAVDNYNQAQVRPLITAIDLGLLDMSDDEEVAKAKVEHQEAANRRWTLERQEELCWGTYSRLYKKAALDRALAALGQEVRDKALADAFGNLLMDAVKINDPIRLL